MVRIRNWMRGLGPKRSIKEIEPAFKVGDRVLDAFHKEITVIEINSKSDHGLGRVKGRYDDGREATFMLAASGLRPIRPKGDANG